MWSLYEEVVAIRQGRGQPNVKCKFCSILIVNAQSRNMLPHATLYSGLANIKKKQEKVDCTLQVNGEGESDKAPRKE